MNALEIVGMAKASGVRLWLEGDRLKYRGPVSVVNAIRPTLAAHKPEIVEYLRATANDADAVLVPADCVGALTSSHGGLYLPWGPYLSARDVARLRADLVGMVEALANLEAWTEKHRTDVLARAIRGPLADLLPNIAHFRERLDAARTESTARARRAARAWHANDDLRNRGH